MITETIPGMIRAEFQEIVSTPPYSTGTESKEGWVTVAELRRIADTVFAATHPR